MYRRSGSEIRHIEKRLASARCAYHQENTQAMACLLDSQLLERKHQNVDRSRAYKGEKRVYFPVLAIRVQGEARSHGPAAGLKVHTSGPAALHEYG